MVMHPNEQYLVEQGYELHPATGFYIVYFVSGGYRAGNAIDFQTAQEAPIEYLKEWHENFIALAKQGYDFNKGVGVNEH